MTCVMIIMFKASVIQSYIIIVHCNIIWQSENEFSVLLLLITIIIIMYFIQFSVHSVQYADNYYYTESLQYIRKNDYELRH